MTRLNERRYFSDAGVSRLWGFRGFGVWGFRGLFEGLGLRV